ncbi:hypothetical protein [Myxosarcina sp. GI1]|uniref:hypothetical protein n=1 Tax=Myxosarcina sp. GI1 TaxID=1541065 RepID=UPI000562CE08|nr:hypothetical protein [Myxosarcina sp. GI1]
MTSFESAFYKEQNDDGSFTPQRRQRLRNKGWSEEKIARTEEILMRDARIDRENAIARKKHDEYCDELSRQRKAERREREKLGIEPTFKILYSSKDKVDINSMSPAKRRAFEMRGLDTEELLSQGYIGFDDLDNSNWNDNEESDFRKLSDEHDSPPEIPF